MALTVLENKHAQMTLTIFQCGLTIGNVGVLIFKQSGENYQQGMLVNYLVIHSELCLYSRTAILTCNTRL